MDPLLSSLVAVHLKKLLKEAMLAAFKMKAMHFRASLDTYARNIMNCRDRNSEDVRKMENGPDPPRFVSQYAERSQVKFNYPQEEIHLKLENGHGKRPYDIKIGDVVSHIILHRDFNVHNNYDSDIALLKLGKAAVLTAGVQLVCLPNRFDLSEANLDSGVPGWVAGWGYNGSDELAAVLTEVQLPVISNRECVRDTVHFTGDPGITRTLTSNMFCAGLYAISLQVSHIILHRDFNVHNNYDSDIALLKLGRPAVLTARVQLVCLPNRFDLSEANLDSGVPGWVAGWGHDGSDELAAVLTEVQLPVISNRKCVRDTRNYTGDPGVTRTLTSNMFCAGFSADTPIEDFRTVCPGDSGSPMVFFSNTSQDSHWTMEGIVSHFFQKGACSMRRPGQYGIFTKVNR
ncbi:unnamed protein product [Darwinula stevensoni]|uniref:Peptidase S1 domain-containing protein n=1 Tax=Darwinula stevensoni TaxID=69355 RepID=A0A7R9FTK8_9CRUS|nr:unnamed protein product [Darwinula stevensoni]CAG0904908.1 unnamed protein product [Darwinula stevensoni]